MEHSKREEKLRKVWRQMKRRCTSPKDDKYYRYGARGIKVCAEWQDYLTFRTWALEAGYLDGLSINRIDNDGDYEPSNCEWTDRITQANNRGGKNANVMITVFGETKNLTQWSNDPRCKVSYAALSFRIKRRGWEPERALTTPAIKNNDQATHCPQGHEYTPDNISWDGPTKTWRKCKACARVRAHAWYHEGPKEGR